ncbi:MAG: hypothetical protein FWH42_04195 [Dehalococcoidia bacterium]|nr:hypothetical protein [Dehalococcoidia bacterium]
MKYRVSVKEHERVLRKPSKKDAGRTITIPAETKIITAKTGKEAIKKAGFNPKFAYSEPLVDNALFLDNDLDCWYIDYIEKKDVPEGADIYEYCPHNAPPQEVYLLIKEDGKVTSYQRPTEIKDTPEKMYRALNWQGELQIFRIKKLNKAMIAIGGVLIAMVILGLLAIMVFDM